MTRELTAFRQWAEDHYAGQGYHDMVWQEWERNYAKEYQNAPFCPYCGTKKQHQVFTDANSPLVCRYPGCPKR